MKKVTDKSELRLVVKFSTKEALEKKFWDGLVEYFDDDKNGTIDSQEFNSLLIGIHSDTEILDSMGEVDVVGPCSSLAHRKGRTRLTPRG